MRTQHESWDIIRTVAHDVDIKYHTFDPACTFEQLNMGHYMAHPEPLQVAPARAREVWGARSDKSFLFQVFARVSVFREVKREYYWGTSSYETTKLFEVTLIHSSDTMDDLLNTLASFILEHRRKDTVADTRQSDRKHGEFRHHLNTLDGASMALVRES